MTTFSRRFCLLLLFAALAAPGLGQIQLETPAMITGLEKPVAFVSAYDGSGRMFIVERCVADLPSDPFGRVSVWDGTSVLATPFLVIPSSDLECSTSSSNEEGLLGIAFHPEYETNGRFYVNYTSNLGAGECSSGDDSMTRVVEHINPTPSDNVAEGSSTVILEICQFANNHNAGQILFGPDGYLYIPMGDGGGAEDPRDHGEDPETLLGSLLRIDVDVPARGTNPNGNNYVIPESNPYAEVGMIANTPCEPDPADETRANPCPEMWAHGLRNPWRSSFDRLNGDLYVGDVGQYDWEEVSRLEWDPVAGALLGGGDDDFGWNLCEGLDGFEGASDEDCDGDGTGSPPINYKPPFVAYDSNAGRCTITGGYVYRGHHSATLQGQYVFGDYCAGDIWTLPARHPDASERWDGGSVPSPLLDLGFGLSSFGEDELGELYVVDIDDGEILRIIDTEAIFVHDFEMGFEAWSSVSP